MRSDIPFYILAGLLGLAAGLLELRLGDLLITALFVLISTMVLGFLRPRSPWRWTVIVGALVPAVWLFSFAFSAQRPYRAQLWESGLGFLTGVAGAYCGAFTHRVINELFRPNRERPK